ncbi:MAG: zinc-ribbon domain-containing protein [Chloroflexota bacterium]
MTVFFSLLLTVLTFVYIVYPLFRQRSAPAVAVDDERQRELSTSRDTAYSMLKELEFDYQSGLLTEEDYQELSTRYKGKAMAILKQLDDSGADSGATDEIETAVLKLRRSQRQAPARGKGQGPVSSPGPEDVIEQQVRRARRSPRRFCTQCGAPAQPEDRFCSSCGASLK